MDPSIWYFFTGLTPSMAQQALSSLIAFCVFDYVWIGVLCIRIVLVWLNSHDTNL